MKTTLTYVALGIFGLALVSAGQICPSGKADSETNRPVAIEIFQSSIDGSWVDEQPVGKESNERESWKTEEDTLEFESWMTDLSQWTVKNN